MNESVYEVAVKPVRSAVVRPPGSKSITNRALVAAALAPGDSVIHNPLHSDDTQAMVGCLSVLGVEVSAGEQSWGVSGSPRPPGGGRLDARASGTTARFLTAAATLAEKPSVLDGTPRLRQRPMDGLIRALRSLGAGLESHNGYPPVRLEGGGLPGGTAAVDASRSSQFLSALLLAAPAANHLVVLQPGPVVVSQPYIDTTREVMTAFGAQVRTEPSGDLTVAPTGYRPGSFRVEADASAAVYPWMAAALTAAAVTVTGIDPASTQADLAALDILEQMGCAVERNSAGITVTGPDRLVGVEADLNHCPDAAVGLSVLTAFTTTGGRFTNLATLRLKETDRLTALHQELSKIGAEVSAGPDWIDIRPAQLRGARIATYDDHRMAMSFAIAGLVVPGMVIENPQCVSKTWPRFFDMLEAL